MLYIVGTPIGNLDDLSLRQAKTLAASDIVLAEDTRSAQTLIQGIKTRFSVQFKSDQKLISYYKETEFEKLPEILDFLKSNETISLISESGMPLISDPGYLLIKSCIKENIPFIVILGPSAVITSLIYSGYNPKEFMFLGFLSKKHAELYRLIDRLKQIKTILPELVIVFYESALRIKTTLQCINELSPDSDIVICREMTKKFEEIIRGNPGDLMKRNYKGQLTIILS